MFPLTIDLPQSKQELDRLTSAAWQAVITSDPCDAVQWMLHGAALGSANAQTIVGHAKSMTKIGHYYEDGLVVQQGDDAAFFAFGEGAHGGDFRGQFNFAGMLAARGQMQEALQWLRKVPQTATPRYRLQAGEKLLQSAHPAFRAMGQQMMDDAPAPEPA